MISKIESFTVFLKLIEILQISHKYIMQYFIVQQYYSHSQELANFQLLQNYYEELESEHPLYELLICTT